MNEMRRERRTELLGLAALAVVVSAVACGSAVDRGSESTPVSTDVADTATEALPNPMLHHLGLNVVDPDVSMAWYQTIWPNGEPSTFDGKPAFKTEIYIIFNQVDEPAPGTWDVEQHRAIPQSAFWHPGINTDTTNLEEYFEANGITTVPLYTRADAPEEIWRSNESPYAGMQTMTQIANMETQDERPGGFAYIVGPDGELVETAGGPQTPDTFNHIHFFHEQPWCAVQWYVDHLGMVPPSRRNPATGETVAVEIPDPCGVEIGDPSFPSLEQHGTLRNPRGTVRYGNGAWSAYSRQCMFGRCTDGDTELVPSRGQVLDHVGFTIPDLDLHVERLRREGVTILEAIHPFANTRAAMIEDLDGLSIHLVEDDGI